MRHAQNVGATFLAVAFSASCSLIDLDYSLVEVEIPSIPPCWDGLEGIELVLAWRDARAEPRRLPVAAGDRPSIELPRGLRRAILVEAWYRGRPLRPAGALWPDDLGPVSAETGLPRLKAGWFEGWKASILVSLEVFGAEKAVDFARLDLEARARLPDPWVVDPKKVALAIRERSFRSDLLRGGTARSLILPNGGPWFGESPFAEAALPVEGGWLSRFLPGLYRLYSRDLELFVAIPEEGEAVILVRGLE